MVNIKNYTEHSVTSGTIGTIGTNKEAQHSENVNNANNDTSVLNVNVSAFRNCASTEPTSVNLLTWLKSNKYKKQVDIIRNEPDKSKRDELKKELPAITPSAVFEHNRDMENMVCHTGLMAFDIDYADNTHIGNFSTLKQQIIKIQNVAYCGLSVSGRGYWGLIPIAYKDKHLLHFMALEKGLKQFGITIDPKCKNIGRLRIYSYDPEGYFNHSAKPFYNTYTPPKPKRKVYEHSGNDVEAQVQSCLNQINFDITSDYKTWFNIGCALANTFGESGRNYFHTISQYHEKYSYQETDEQYTDCLKHNYHSIHINSFFYYCKNAGITPERTKEEIADSYYVDKLNNHYVLMHPKGYPADWDIETPLDKLIKKNPLVAELVKKFDLVNN